MADLSPDAGYGSWTPAMIPDTTANFNVSDVNSMVLNSGFMCGNFTTVFSGLFSGTATITGSHMLAQYFLPEGTYLIQASLRKNTGGDPSAGNWVGTVGYLSLVGAFVKVASINTASITYRTGSAILKNEATGWRSFGLNWDGVAHDFCGAWIGIRRLVGTT